MLFRDVWNYNFVPQSILVDVHMSQLRSKIDQPDEAPMIYSVRGQGFVLHAPANTRPPRKFAFDAGS